MRSLSRSALRLVVVMMVATLAPLVSARPAAADTTALTDDRSVSVPTGWWTYTNVTTSQVSTYLSANKARLTDVEPFDAGGTTFTVTMVSNAGSYAVPGWWWYVNLDGPALEGLLSQNNARLVDIEAYPVNGVIKYAAVMVSNTGSAARAWSWLYGVSASQVGSHVSGTNTRLIDFESYLEGGVRKYAIVGVANTGSDARSWQYWFAQTAAEVSTRIANFNGRITNLERQSDGRFNVILVANTGAENKAWWWYYDLSSAAAALNLANQHGARIFDIESYLVSGVRRYAAVLIDNSNTSTRRIRGLWAPALFDSSGRPRGVHSSYLKRVGGAVITDLNSNAVVDPASALKALHNLHAMRRVQANADALGNSFVYYNYTTSGAAKDACPTASEEVASNRVTTTLDAGLDSMMQISDNRTTRGVVLRYGFSAINATATAAGMTKTVLRQDIGCGYRDGIRNATTVHDLSKLYEGVENSTLLTGTNRTEFFDRMNGGGGVNEAIKAIVRAEATSLGKSSTTANAFISAMTWRFKPGGYGICSPTSCATYTSTGSIAGRMTMFAKNSSGVLLERDYVFGNLHADVPIGCSGCASQSSVDAANAKTTAELFREQIRTNLATWASS